MSDKLLDASAKRKCSPKDPRFWGHIMGWVAAGLGILSFGFIFQPVRFNHSDGAGKNGFGVCYGQPFWALFLGLVGAALQVVPLLGLCAKTRPFYEKANKFVNLWSKGIVWIILGIIGMIIAWSASYPPFLDHHVCFQSQDQGDWCYDTPAVTLQDKLFSVVKQRDSDSCQQVKDAGACANQQSGVPEGLACLAQCYPDMKTCADIKSNNLCDTDLGEVCISTCKPCIPNNIYCCNLGPPVYFGFALVIGIAYFVFFILTKACKSMK